MAKFDPSSRHDHLSAQVSLITAFDIANCHDITHYGSVGFVGPKGMDPSMVLRSV